MWAWTFNFLEIHKSTCIMYHVSSYYKHHTLNIFTNYFIFGDFSIHDPKLLTTQYTDTRPDTITAQLDRQLPPQTYTPSISHTTNIFWHPEMVIPKEGSKALISTKTYKIRTSWIEMQISNLGISETQYNQENGKNQNFFLNLFLVIYIWDYVHYSVTIIWSPMTVWWHYKCVWPNRICFSL